MRIRFFHNLLFCRATLCVYCNKQPAGKTKRVETCDVPRDKVVEGTIHYRACDGCFLPKLCPYCGKSNNNNAAKYIDLPDGWELVPLEKWKRSPPAASEKVHASCKRGITKARVPPSEAGAGAGAAKKQKQPPKDKVTTMTLTVKLGDLTSPLSSEEGHLLYLLVNRKMNNSEQAGTQAGGSVIIVGSMFGGPKMHWMHCPHRTGTSSKTLQRAARVVEKAAVTLQANEVLTCKMLLKRISGGHFGKRNGLKVAYKFAFHPDDLDVLKAELQMTGCQVVTFVRIMRNRHHIVFGQSVLEHNQRIKDMRMDIKYTSEKVLQEDGLYKCYHFSRAESVGDLIASRVSMLKNEGAWEDKQYGDPSVLGFEVPFGSVFISVLVRYFNFKLHKHSPRSTVTLAPLLIFSTTAAGASTKFPSRCETPATPVQQST